MGLNNYKQIGSVPYDSMSLFVDTVRAKYFPNTGDPNAGTYKYKLQIRDSCGGLSPLSDDHNTIFMINNSGTFSWPQLYLVGGVTNPVSNYILMRDNLSDGNWTIVNSVSGSQQTVTDPQYATYQSTASWRVETQWSISCNPSKMLPGINSYNASRSNIFSLTTGVNEYYNNLSVTVSPNPSDGKFVITWTENLKGTLLLTDIFGKSVLEVPVSGEQQRINHELAPGVYFYQLTGEKGLAAAGKCIVK